jgi:hypothetical protein
MRGGSIRWGTLEAAAPLSVMAVLGTTIHELLVTARSCLWKLVDGRTKSVGEGRQASAVHDEVGRPG